jgi:hypothetical protein
MKLMVLLQIFFSGAIIAGETAKYLAPDAPPEYHIQSVTVPGELTNSLKIVFKITTVGKTPIAVSQENLAYELKLSGKSSAYYGDLVFPATEPQILIVQPHTNRIVAVTITKDNFNRIWSASGPGTYDIRICSGSGKSRHFDYEFMGQSHSAPYIFEVKITNRTSVKEALHTNDTKP